MEYIFFKCLQGFFRCLDLGTCSFGKFSGKSFLKGLVPSSDILSPFVLCLVVAPQKMKAFCLLAAKGKIAMVNIYECVSFSHVLWPLCKADLAPVIRRIQGLLVFSAFGMKRTLFSWM